MKRLIFIITVICVAMQPFGAYAAKNQKSERRSSNQGKKYISVIGGYAKSNSVDAVFSDSPSFDIDFNYKSNFTFGGALGYYPGNNLRIEGEVMYRGIDIDTINVNGIELGYGSELKLLNLMFNSYYTVPLNRYVSPYVGGGVGWSNEMENDTKNAFAYQLMTGIDWDFDYSSSISAGYRYFKAGEFETATVGGGLANYDVVQHIYEISYRLKF